MDRFQTKEDKLIEKLHGKNYKVRRSVCKDCENGSYKDSEKDICKECFGYNNFKIKEVIKNN